MSFKAVYKLEFKRLLRLFLPMSSTEIRYFLQGLFRTHDDIPLLEQLMKAYCLPVGWLCANPHAFHWIEEGLGSGRLSERDIDWKNLSLNPNAVPLLEKHLDKVNWCMASMNPGAMPLLEKHADKVDWELLATNPSAVPLLEKLLNKRTLLDILFPFLRRKDNALVWKRLSSNPKAVPLLEKHLRKVDWSSLSTNPNAIHLLETHLDKVDWFCLAHNPRAIHLLEAHPNKIRAQDILSNPNALHLLSPKIARIYFERFVQNQNPDAVPLIRELFISLDRISASEWLHLGCNPNIAQILGEINYMRMRENCRSFACELAKAVLHPSRLLRMSDAYGLDVADYLERIGD